MAQERGSFRRKLFGGFDRTDVINYIETVAEQRNKYQAEAQRYANESVELHTKLDNLTAQLQDKDARFADTSKELDTARKELNDVWKELRETMDELETVKGQLERVSKELVAKSAQYDKDITAAQKALENEKRKGEEQRIAAVNSASQITAELRVKYNDTKLGVEAASEIFIRELDAVSENMSAMSTAFTDAETKIQQLLADKEN